jgi:hypothetical protein
MPLLCRKGTVTDQTAAVIAGAKVKITSARGTPV